MHIALLEDDIDLGQAVVDHLEAHGHTVHWCKLIAQVQAPAGTDLALLDLRLPDGDALPLLRQWRAAGRRLPVIVLTARDQISDRIAGLRAGADDYLMKPFDLDEMLARIQAVHRRCAPAPQLRVQDAALDLAAQQAWRSGAQVDLTAMEWAVLACLAQQPGRIFDRDTIHRHLAQHRGAGGDSNSLEVIVSRLRKKLGSAAISTHRNLGYRLDV